MAKFKSGESGNPGGRPAGHGEIREIARKHTDAAINTLVKVMSDSAAPPRGLLKFALGGLFAISSQRATD